MAVSVSTVVNPASVNNRSFDITASADADTIADIVHGIEGLTDPDKQLKISFEPLNPAAYTAAWTVTSRDQGGDKSTVRVTKSTATSSGNAAAQVRVHVQRMHSLVD